MWHHQGSLLAVTGGLLQIGMSFNVLLLPTIKTCSGYGQESICRQESYIQVGGNLLGYGFLVLMIVVGIMAVASAWIDNPTQVGMLRGFGALASAAFVVLGAWSIGLSFLPGAALLLVAALWRQRPQAAD